MGVLFLLTLKMINNVEPFSFSIDIFFKGIETVQAL